MSDRYEIFDEGSQIRILYSGSISTIISGPLGTHIEDAVIGAIRQQARDLEQLRADLAAAVAERSEYWGALHSTKDELFESRSHSRALESDLRITRDQRNTLRARLAAIDSAPTRIDDAMVKRVLARFFDALPIDSSDEAHTWLTAWRAELGQTLGLVELKEPTPEECERICMCYLGLDSPPSFGAKLGREVFDAVSAVMWPKEGL